jgi:shikimate kinase
MLNLVLVGFMGTGKTSVGKHLSETLNMELVDTDEIVTRRSGLTISEIFARFGEAHFRDLEEEAVEVASDLKNCIISTGGGVVLRKRNLELLGKSGVIFCLSATAEEIYERISSESHRPLLKVGNALDRIKQMLEFRAPYYAQADYTISTSNKSVPEIAEEIAQTFIQLSAISNQQSAKNKNENIADS